MLDRFANRLFTRGLRTTAGLRGGSSGRGVTLGIFGAVGLFNIFDVVGIVGERLDGEIVHVVGFVVDHIRKVDVALEHVEVVVFVPFLRFLAGGSALGFVRLRGGLFRLFRGLACAGLALGGHLCGSGFFRGFGCSRFALFRLFDAFSIFRRHVGGRFRRLLRAGATGLLHRSRFGGGFDCGRFDRLRFFRRLGLLGTLCALRTLRTRTLTLRGLRTRFSRIARIPLRALMPVALLVAVGLGGCSVVHVNGSMRTTERTICVVEPGLVEPEVHEVLLELLKKKRFDVRTLPRDAAPGACRLTLVYSWRKEQYYLPALVKQFAISLDLYVDGEKYANASFDPLRNLVSPHVKFIPFSRYLARVLDRLFPGRPVIGA